MESPDEPALEARLQQERVLADLGQQALAARDLDPVQAEACAAVAEMLDTEYSAVLEVLPDSDAAVLRDGIGWADGSVGSATVSTDRDSHVGDTLRSEEAVILDDFRTETRVSGPDLFASHEVVSGVSTVIGSVDEPWGVLGAYTTEQRTFTPSDASFVQRVANLLGTAIDRTAVERSDAIRTLIEHSADTVFVIDPDTESILDVNATAVERLGYERDDLLGSTVGDIGLEFSPQNSFSTFVDELEAVGQRVVDGAYRDADGSTLPVSITATSVELDRPYVLAVCRDVSEQREREQALERIHRRMEVALHVGDATVWEWEPETDEVITHPDPHGLFGTEIRTSEEYVARIHPDDRSRARTALADALETDSSYRIEFRYDDGKSVRWAEDYGEVFPSPETEGRRMIGIVRDVTERKRGELELEEANWRYRSLVNHFPNGAVALFDHDLRFTATGGELLDAPGVDDPRGSTLQERYPDDLVAAIEPHFRAALAGDSREFEVEFMGRYVLARAVPVRNVANEQFAGMVVLLDVTERREYRQQLEESHRRLEEFASAISHDLREPLGTVANYLRLLERRYEAELDEDAAEFIEFAVNGAVRMREMIDGLVTTYARIDSEGDRFESVPLEAVVDDVVLDLQPKIAANDAEITVGALPTVTGDAGQLRQLLLNLVDNAIKYAGTGPPRIEISADRNEDVWAISVRDEGIGMDSGATERIFEVFQRLHPDEEYPGTGIGLALCKRIVERHGGEMWADAELGEGATFTFTIPIDGESS